MRRRKQHSCWSKYEQRFYLKGREGIHPSAQLIEAIGRYIDMHRRCTQVDEWGEFFKDHQTGTKAGADLSGCTYLLFAPPAYHGVGNRLMSLLSAFTFALLTSRTFLMPDNAFMAHFFCNPFLHSNWTVPADVFWPMRQSVYDEGDGTSEGRTKVKLHVSWDSPPSGLWPFCEESERNVRSVPWLAFYTDYYLVPGFYLVPTFQSQLEALFPDRRVFTHLGRYLLHPTNYLWDRITRIFHGQLAHHATTIGVQLRVKDEETAGVSDRVIECATNIARLLPDVVPNDNWRHLATHAEDESLRLIRSPSVAVLVTSLHPSHFDALKQRFSQGKPKDGSVVSVFR